MASTYSTNLKIELMGTGENSGTWGTITNTNLGTAFEQAVIGLGNPDYTSDANLTITLTNSNAAQAARALVLNVTSAFGSLTATRELIVPTIQKQYIVQNNTTGGQSITVKTSGGTGITVPNGRKAHLYVDGTNVIQMFDFVDINGGAIDGTAIGATSASTGAFTSLTASGATTLNGAVALGDAAGDLITVPGTVNSNLLFTDATYDIGASGATRPRDMFLSRNLTVGGTLTLAGGVNLNGNVTVGDSSADTLTINSTITSNLIFTDNTYDIGASGATRPRNLFLAGNATIGGAQTLTGALTVDSTTDSSSTTTGSIQTDGGVGIAKALFVGTTANIAGVATFSAGSAAAPAITTTGDTNTGIWFPAADTIAFTEGGVESMRIDASGNLGIGVTPNTMNPGSGNIQLGNSANRWAWVGVDPNGSAVLAMNTYYNSGYKYAGPYGAGMYLSNFGAHEWFTAASGTADAAISFTQVMTLNASGNLGVGETSPAARLDLKSSATDFTGVILNNTSTSGKKYNIVSAGSASYFDIPTGAFGIRDLTAGVSRLVIDTSGNVGIGTSSPSSYAADADNLVLASSGNTGMTIKSGATSTGNLYFANAENSTSNNGTIEVDHNVLAMSFNIYGTGRSFRFKSAGTEVMRLDSAGNLGLGVTPSAWDTLTALQIKNGSVYGYSTGDVSIGVNNYYGTSNFRYITSSVAAGKYTISGNEHVWYQAPSGTAGNAITFTQAMTLASTGNLSLGTTSTLNYGAGGSYKNLSIDGGTSADARAEISLAGGGGGANYNLGRINFGLSASTTNAAAIIQGLSSAAGASTGGVLAFYTAADISLAAVTEKMRITSAGNVGIGTSSPGSKLTVSGTNSDVYGQVNIIATGAGADAQIVFSTPLNGRGIYLDDSDTNKLKIYGGAGKGVAADEITITNTGNVGIGTSSPAVNGVDIVRSAGTSTYLSTSDGTYTAYYGIAPALGGAWFGSVTNAPLLINTNGTERARIDTSGNLLVGTTSAINSSTRGNFYNASSASSVVGIQNAQNVSGDVVTNWLIGSNANNTSSYFLQCGVSGVANVLYIYGNGNVQNTNNSYGGISDVKLKENIVDATPKLADLMQVKVRNFNLIGSTTKQIGVVAQELETIFPAMVDESPDRDTENNVLETTTKSVKYSVFVPMLIKALQEQQAIIESLKARLDAANL